ncbi:uncharacterized protein LOC143044284 [Mytilus galloprovincialis]|uniref:uncharacterized protein LOC143044284 n=1 Tax=Mytilus galloprovincialis TaxID=29158 RepID=UPI003F7CAC74
MTFSVLIWFTAFVGYTTTTGIEDLKTYHVVTDFLPVHSTIIPKLCNETYSERNVTRQIAEKNETSGQFEIVCNISDNTGTTDKSLLQTCLSDVFINIEFHFSCNNSDQQQEIFLASYPYDNNIYNVTDYCDEPVLQELKILNQSSDVYWSVCEDISKTVMTNCSVRCDGKMCFINTICVREISPKCLIQKYVRLSYECEQDSMNLENKEVLIYIDCGNKYLIDMKDISIQQKRQSCSETQMQCFISDKDKTQIIDACHNQMKCTKPIKLNSKCLYTTEYAYYNISYKCSNDNQMSESSCHKINETITISCDMGLLENQQLSITYQPSEVGDCLQINNLTFKFKPDVCDGGINITECKINLLKEGLTDHPCLYVNTHMININHSCMHDPFYSNMSKGEATLSHMFTIKPHRGTTDTFSSERTSTTNADLTNSVEFVESSTTSVVQTKIEPVSVGTIIGVTVGSIVLTVIFGVIVYWRRVYMMKHNTDRRSESVVGSALQRTSLKDYTGVQMVAYPGESNIQLTKDNPTNNMYTVVSGDPQNKFENDQIDHLKGKRIDIEIEKSATGYSLVRPNPNELPLPNMQLQISQADSGYSLAKQISKEHNNKGNYGHSSSDNITSKDYEISPEGVYDRSNSRRNKNNINVYDRAVDNTYDTADHNNKQRTDDDGNAYDHFIGPKTNDNYEQVMRNNKVVSNDTYGVH